MPLFKYPLKSSLQITPHGIEHNKTMEELSKLVSLVKSVSYNRNEKAYVTFTTNVFDDQFTITVEFFKHSEEFTRKTMLGAIRAMHKCMMKFYTKSLK